MEPVQLAVTVAVCVVGVPVGFFFGSMPLRTNVTTDRQSKLQQVIGLIAVAVVLVLIVSGQETASWAVLVAMLAGVLVARIPPIHRAMIRRFPLFAPRDPNAPAPRPAAAPAPAGANAGRGEGRRTKAAPHRPGNNGSRARKAARRRR